MHSGARSDQAFDAYRVISERIVEQIEAGQDHSTCHGIAVTLRKLVR